MNQVLANAGNARNLKNAVWGVGPMRSVCLIWLSLLVAGTTQWRMMAPRQSHVCIVTCDFWGLPAAGGTATAYHLLASSLATGASTHWPVTFLGATRHTELCQEIQRNFTSEPINFACLEQRHFSPTVVESYPYESIGIAVVRWLQTEGSMCDVIHAHEWGGGMQQLAAVVSMRHKLNRRMIVEPHGGHYWSTQGTRQRPIDLFTLRIDDHERLTMHLADDVKSPSAYMLAHLRQRGWYMPPEASVIPNIIPQASTSAKHRQQRRVWRLAFFGRLEERKGLKLFCGAVELLFVSRFSGLEVTFVGGEAQVDMKPSIEYLRDRTADWPITVNIFGGLSRLAALAVLKTPGVMVVFASLVENLPFALAEASIEEIPFITFDVGGVTELFDPIEHADVIVDDVSMLSLHQRMYSILKAGHVSTSVLSVGVKNSEAAWHQLHVRYDEWGAQGRTYGLSKAASKVRVVQISSHQSSVELKSKLCRNHRGPAVLLFIPPEFDVPLQADMSEIGFLASQLPRLYESRKLGALVFGAKIGDNKVSYPSSPTWIIYHGAEPLCVENVPLLVQKHVFCSSFLAEARDFPVFQTWLLIRHMKISGLSTTTYFEPVFLLKNFSRYSAGCLSDRIPEFRMLTGDRAANLQGHSEDVLMLQHLAARPRPVSSLRNDFDKHQGQHGWQYVTFDEQGEILNALCIDMLLLCGRTDYFGLQGGRELLHGHLQRVRYRMDHGLVKMAL